MPRKAACWQWSAEGRKEAGGRGDEERDEAEEKKVELATYITQGACMVTNAQVSNELANQRVD